MDTAHAILGETPPPLTRYTENIPVLLQHTVRKMLAKEPDDRYQLIHDVRTDLAVLIHEIEEVLAKPTTAPPIGVTSVIQPPLWKKALPWSIAALVVVIAAIMLWNPSSTAPTTSTSTSQPVVRFVAALPADLRVAGRSRTR